MPWPLYSVVSLILAFVSPIRNQPTSQYVTRFIRATYSHSQSSIQRIFLPLAIPAGYVIPIPSKYMQYNSDGGFNWLGLRRVFTAYPQIFLRYFQTTHHTTPCIDPPPSYERNEKKLEKRQDSPKPKETPPQTFRHWLTQKKRK